MHSSRRVVDQHSSHPTRNLTWFYLIFFWQIFKPKDWTNVKVISKKALSCFFFFIKGEKINTLQMYFLSLKRKKHQSLLKKLLIDICFLEASFREEKVHLALLQKRGDTLKPKWFAFKKQPFYWLMMGKLFIFIAFQPKARKVFFSYRDIQIVPLKDKSVSYIFYVLWMGGWK